jgi:hypothetical protein
MTSFSKGIRIGDYREQLEEALGLPLEEFVRKSGDSAIAAGPIRFRVNGARAATLTLSRACNSVQGAAATLAFTASPAL